MAEKIDDLRRVIDGLRGRIEALEATQSRPRASPLKPMGQEAKVEGWIAGYGFARLGIISLVTGVAFLVADSYQWLGAPMKILLGFCIAAAFVALGRSIAKKSSTLSQVLIAGGLGIAYYTTYAMHYVPAAAILHSATAALALLSALVVVIVFIAHRMQSETVAGVALYLGLHTGMVSPIGSFTLISSVLLACGAAFFLAKNRWVYVPVSTLIAVYATHLLWILGNPMIAAESTHALGHFNVSIAFALLYFATFSVALVLASGKLRKSTTVLFASLNWGALMAILCFEFSTHHAEGLALALLALAVASALMAYLCHRQQENRAASEIQLVLAVTTLAFAAWVGGNGITSMVLSWCITSLITLALARALHMHFLSSLSAVILGIAYGAQFTAIGDLPIAALLVGTTLLHHTMVRESREQSSAGASKGHGPHDYAHAAALAWLSLSTVASALPSELVVLCWLLVALVLFVLGTQVADYSYRMAAFAIFAITFLRLFLVDMASMASGYRIAAFIALGFVLLGISYASTRRSLTSESRAPSANMGDET